MKPIWFALWGLFAGSLSISPFAQAGYGAIEYSVSTGRYGYADGYDSYQQAVYAAYASCGITDCFLVNWEQNECNALATGANGRWGSGYGFDNSTAAINMAVAECGAGCVWAAWICD